MKKGIAIKLLKNRQVRQLGLRLLRNPRVQRAIVRNPRVQRAIVKQVTRRLSKR